MKNIYRIFNMNVRKNREEKNFSLHHLKRMVGKGREKEKEEEEAEVSDTHQVPGVRDEVMSRHAGTS